MKSISLGLAIATTTLGLTLSTQPSQASDCANHWTNPSTGQMECLGDELQVVPEEAAAVSGNAPADSAPVTAASGSFQPGGFDFSDLAALEGQLSELMALLEIRNLEGSATGLVTHLKDCKPYRYRLALAFMPEFSISQTITGWEGDSCGAVASVMTPDQTAEETVAHCQFSPASLATLTDAQSYAEAQALDSNNWQALADESTAPGLRSQAIFERECQAVE
jgi:hypothetical protein